MKSYFQHGIPFPPEMCCVFDHRSRNVTDFEILKFGQAWLSHSLLRNCIDVLFWSIFVYIQHKFSTYFMTMVGRISILLVFKYVSFEIVSVLNYLLHVLKLNN